MIGETSFSYIATVATLTVFPFALAWVFFNEVGKVKEKFNGLPSKHIPNGAYAPAIIKSIAIGVFSFLLIIGLTKLPF